MEQFFTVPSKFDRCATRLFKYLSCIDRDEISLDSLERVAIHQGMKMDDKRIHQVIEELHGSIDGRTVLIREKEEAKQQFFSNFNAKVAIINGREDEGHAKHSFKGELDKREIHYEEYWLDGMGFESGKLTGFPLNDDYFFILLTNPEFLEHDSAPVYLLKARLLQTLEQLHRIIPTIDQDLVARSKLHSSLAWHACGIQTPKTMVTQSIHEALEFIERHHQEGKDVVIKPLAKGGGWAVSKISRGTGTSKIIDTLGKYKWWYGNGCMLLQEFIENAGFDTRVLILDDIILGAERRFPAPEGESWIYNISKGASGALEWLTPHQVRLARHASSCTSQFFTGVDMIQDTSGIDHVLEINSCPGFKGFERHLDMNVAGFIITCLCIFS
ncbi:hypothetical protein GF325_19135 [Candidatus Bathyarchaeota archaeon]|nr:hypothetical protein [Candidatus Bathyarchaeota archaeon]